MNIPRLRRVASFLASALSFALLILSGLVPAHAAGAGTWKAGDKVEVKWEQQWYPAVILEVKDDIYKIHYEGYGSSWDEWVGTDRIRPAAKAAPAVPQAENGGAWKVGDKVEAWNVAWYPAEIKAVGTDEHLGYYMVHYEKFSAASDQWIKAENIRAREGGAGSAGLATPRLGVYRVMSFGSGGRQIALGELELQANGRYVVRLPGGRVRGEGKYVYDSASTTVKWLTGPYREDDFGGTFEVSREGRTHQITLRRGTVAANSTD